MTVSPVSPLSNNPTAPLVHQLRTAARVITVQPWMVAELGLAAVWFAQLLWRMDGDDTYTIVCPDHAWGAETGMSQTQVHRARVKVAERGWIECQVKKIAGAPTTHITLQVEALEGHLREMHFAESKDPGLRDSDRTSTSQKVEELTLGDFAEPPAFDPVREVFTAWVESTGRDKSRTKLTAERVRCIKARMKDGYDLNDLIDAVRGWKRSPFHRGENERKVTYDDLTFLLRDGTHVEKFRNLERDKKSTTNNPQGVQIR